MTYTKEEQQGVSYLDSKRNWHLRQIGANEWEYDFHGFSSKVFFLADGKIGMEYAGRVIIRSIEHWISIGQET